MKAPKNVVFLSVDSIRTIKDIPVLRVKIHLPEIVVDGYRIRKHTNSLYLTIDNRYDSEFIICTDYTLLEEHIDNLNITRYKLKEYRIGQIISTIHPDAAISVLNALIVKTYTNCILLRYKEYDGFNINVDITDPRFVSAVGEEEKKRSGQMITQYSKQLIKLLKE